MFSCCGWGKFVEGKKQEEEGRGITRAITRLETLMQVKYNIKCFLSLILLKNLSGELAGSHYKQTIILFI